MVRVALTPFDAVLVTQLFGWTPVGRSDVDVRDDHGLMPAVIERARMVPQCIGRRRLVTNERRKSQVHKDLQAGARGIAGMDASVSCSASRVQPRALACRPFSQAKKSPLFRLAKNRNI
jgi:hypothetical protein